MTLYQALAKAGFRPAPEPPKAVVVDVRKTPAQQWAEATANVRPIKGKKSP